MRIRSGSATDETRADVFDIGPFAEGELPRTGINRDDFVIQLQVPHGDELVQIVHEAAITRIAEVGDVVHVWR